MTALILLSRPFSSVSLSLFLFFLSFFGLPSTLGGDIGRGVMPRDSQFKC